MQNEIGSKKFAAAGSICIAACNMYGQILYEVSECSKVFVCMHGIFFFQQNYIFLLKSSLLRSYNIGALLNIYRFFH